MVRNTAFRLLAGLAAISAALLIAYGSLSAPFDGPGLPHIDKVQHLVAYGVLAVFACLAAGHRHAGLLAALVGYGGLMELAQGLMAHGREPSLADAVANTLGVLLGAAIVSRAIRQSPIRRP